MNGETFANGTTHRINETISPSSHKTFILQFVDTLGMGSFLRQSQFITNRLWGQEWTLLTVEHRIYAFENEEKNHTVTSFRSVFPPVIHNKIIFQVRMSSRQ